MSRMLSRVNQREVGGTSPYPLLRALYDARCATCPTYAFRRDTLRPSTAARTGGGARWSPQAAPGRRGAHFRPPEIARSLQGLGSRRCGCHTGFDLCRHDHESFHHVGTICCSTQTEFNTMYNYRKGPACSGFTYFSLMFPRMVFQARRRIAACSRKVRDSRPSTHTQRCSATDLRCVVVHYLLCGDVAFIPHKQFANILACTLVDLVQPLLYVVERFRICHVVHHDDAVCSTEVHGNDFPKALLTGQVPYL